MLLAAIWLLFSSPAQAEVKTSGPRPCWCKVTNCNFEDVTLALGQSLMCGEVNEGTCVRSSDTTCQFIPASWGRAGIFSTISQAEDSNP